MPLGSELVTILTDYADLSLSALSPSDALNKELDQDLMTQGDQDFVNKLDYTLEGPAHNQASILSLRFSSHPGLQKRHFAYPTALIALIITTSLVSQIRRCLRVAPQTRRSVFSIRRRKSFCGRLKVLLMMM